MNPNTQETLDRTIAPAVHDMGPLSLPEDNRTVLSNGVTLHTLNGGDTEVCRVKVLIPGGIAESPRPQLYQLANSLSLEGTRNHPGDSLADILEYNGAWSSAEISTHHSALSLFTSNSAYHKLLPLVSEMIMTPEYAPDPTAHALRKEAARIEVEQQRVAYRAAAAMRRMLYGENHPLAAIPSPDSLLAITPEDLHLAHDTRLDPKGMHVYLSGLLTDRMISEAEQIFSEIPAKSPFSLPRLVFPEHSAGARTHVDMPHALQSGVQMSIASIGRNHPDYIALRMAVIALGGYFGSRLMLNIREDKGLTYGISASLYGYRHSSFITISSQTDPSTVERLIEESILEIENMKNPSTYSPDEIDRLSRFVLSELAGVLDTPFSRCDFLQTEVTAATPPGYFAMQEHTARTLTPELLADMASKYFDTTKLFISTAGK
ncbi:MAG: insulinase family protein [Bacteroides sp.]|nr:insulinase family protein [Bacteroides sp.]